MEFQTFSSKIKAVADRLGGKVVYINYIHAGFNFARLYHVSGYYQVTTNGYKMADIIMIRAEGLPVGNEIFISGSANPDYIAGLLRLNFIDKKEVK